MSDRTKLPKQQGAIPLIMAVLLLWGFAGAGPQNSLPVASPVTFPVARVQNVRGQLFVRYRNAKVYTPLKKGEPVFGGDIVRTGAHSSATILLSNSAELLLGACMAMEIPLPAQPAKRALRERGLVKKRPLKKGTKG